jgi:hypothetical protein
MCDTVLSFARDQLLPIARDHLFPLLKEATNMIRGVPKEVVQMKKITGATESKQRSSS